MSRIICYLRVSTVNQVEDGAGLDAQRDACEAWASARGLEIAEVHQDAGISGAKPPHERPGLMSAIASLSEGDTLLVYKRDRLSRDMMASLLSDDLIKRQGARIISTQGEASDDDSPTGQFIRTVLDAVSQYERAMIRARLMAGRAAKKARGHRTTGIAPYGYQTDPTDSGRLIVHESEQAILREISALKAAGMSLREISSDLMARGITSRTGKAFAPKMINTILKRKGA